MLGLELLAHGPTKQQDHIVALDGVRGIGALTIVCGHGLEALGYLPWVPHMQAGVDMFFALSGFVVGLSYQPRMEAGIGFGEFMIRRLIRLYPLLPLAVVWGMVTYLLRAGMHGQASVGAVLGSGLLHAVFLPSPLLIEGANDAAWAINVPLWSLTSELFVSVLFGALLWKLRTRGLLICALVGAVGFAQAAFRVRDTNVGIGWYELDATLLRPVYSFCVGLLLWRATRGRPQSRRRISVWWVLAAVVLVLFVPRIGPQQSALDLGFGLFLVFFVMPALLYALAVWSNTPPWSHRVLTMLGQASFAVYVMHLPLVYALHFVAKRVGLLERAPWLLLGLDVLVSFVVGYAVERLYDEPVRNWLTRLSKKRTAKLVRS